MAISFFGLFLETMEKYELRSTQRPKDQHKEYNTNTARRMGRSIHINNDHMVTTTLDELKMKAMSLIFYLVLFIE